MTQDKAVDPRSEFITVPEWAARFNVSRSAAYRLVREGYVPHVRLGPRLIRIPVSALDVTLPEGVDAVA